MGYESRIYGTNIVNSVSYLSNVNMKDHEIKENKINTDEGVIQETV